MVINIILFYFFIKLTVLNACYHDTGSIERTEHAQEVPMDGGQQQPRAAHCVSSELH